MTARTVIVADLTAVSFTCEGSWQHPQAVTIHDGDGTLLCRIPARCLAATSGREALLAAADAAADIGVLTADPAHPGRRLAVPVAWYVPATGRAKLGPSHSDAPLVAFTAGLALPVRGWAFGTWNSADGTLTVTGSPPANTADPMEQSRLGQLLVDLAA